jgi:hypothetical protein
MGGIVGFLRTEMTVSFQLLGQPSVDCETTAISFSLTASVGSLSVTRNPMQSNEVL